MLKGFSAMGVAKSPKSPSGSAEGGTETKSPNPGEVGNSSPECNGGVWGRDIRVRDGAAGFLSGNMGLALDSSGLDDIRSNKELDWLDDA